jgi:hypothetical protein
MTNCVDMLVKEYVLAKADGRGGFYLNGLKPIPIDTLLSIKATMIRRFNDNYDRKK